MTIGELPNPESSPLSSHSLARFLSFDLSSIVMDIKVNVCLRIRGAGLDPSSVREGEQLRFMDYM